MAVKKDDHSRRHNYATFHFTRVHEPTEVYTGESQTQEEKKCSRFAHKNNCMSRPTFSERFIGPYFFKIIKNNH